MKITLSWLKDYLKTDKTKDEILNGLLSIGLEVESVIDFNEELSQFTVAKILKAHKHPDADKLQICEVETTDGIKQIVCGANNASAGIKVIYAKEGTYLKTIDLKLKKSNIRGIDSFGMMLSERELGISDEHNGIIEVEDKFQIGEKASNALYLNDVVIDVAITANIGYLLSIKSIARDLAALGLGVFKDKNYKEFSIQNNASNIDIKLDSRIVKSMVICEINGLKNVESPDWMKTRLRMVGQKPISALVDITNYLMIELNHPMHVYDAKKMSKDITVTYGDTNDKIIALNNQVYNDLKNIPVIKSGDQVVGIAGCIGSKEHSSYENTTSVILECASFVKEEIFKLQKILKLKTDASYRFERDVNSEDLREASMVACAMIKELCGGEIVSLKQEKTKEFESKIIKVTINFINNLLGIQLEKEKILDYLKKLDFKILQDNNGQLTVSVPSFRTDIENEYGIVEVIMKMYGMDKIPTKPIIKDNFRSKSFDNNFEKYILAKRSLARYGLFEMSNMSFISEKDAKLFNVFKEELKLANPISIDLAIMRMSLIPSLVINLSNNTKRGYPNIGLFEVSNIFSSLDCDDQIRSAAGILSGYKTYKDWKNANTTYDIFDAKAKLFCLLEDLNLNPQKLVINKNELPSYYHPGKSGAIYIGKTAIAYFGELHPIIIKEFNLKAKSVIFELMLDLMPVTKSKDSTNLQMEEISSLMPFERDFSFIFNKEINANQVIKIVSSIDKKLIKNIKIFDVYEGDKLDNNQKSIAFSIFCEPITKTLNDEEISEISDKIISSISIKLGGRLRDS